MLLVKHKAGLVVESSMSDRCCFSYFSVSFSICILASILIDTVTALATASAGVSLSFFFASGASRRCTSFKAAARDRVVFDTLIGVANICIYMF